MRVALFMAPLVIFVCESQAVEPALAPRASETVSASPILGTEPPCLAAPCGRPEFPPPHPCKHGSYLRYRANYFGYNSFDYRRVFDYAWPAGNGCCGATPIVAPRPAAHELQPTPASEMPRGAARATSRR